MHRTLVLFAIVAASLLSIATTQAADRPNVIVIYTDDQRDDTISAYGNEHIETPNFDSLVNSGFNFMRNYCMGSMSGAVCVPSRAMLMSGRQVFNVDYQLKSEPLMPRVFSEAGYKSFGVGKWHNGGESFKRAFDNGKTVMLGGMSDHTKVPLVDVVNGEITNKRVGDGFSSKMFADSAVEFLNAADADKPYFLYVAFTAPHDPRQPQEPLGGRSKETRPPLPKNFMPQHPFDNGALIIRDENLGAWPRTEDIVRDQLAEYYGLVEHLDAQVGRILEAAKSRDDGANTIICYAADHGLAIGSHGLLGKQSVYEHSMGSPMVITGPGIPHGKTHKLNYLYDIFPTLCSLTGVEPPEGVDGKDLTPLFAGKDAKPLRRAQLLAYQKGQRAIVTNRWKLIRYPLVNHTQLFDLKSDPNELKNLAEESDHAERVEKMMKQLARLQKQAGDDAPLTSEEPKPMFRDLTGTPRKTDRWQPAWIVEKYFDAAEQ